MRTLREIAAAGGILALAIATPAHAGGWYLMQPPSMGQTHCQGWLSEAVDRAQRGEAEHNLTCRTDAAREQGDVNQAFSRSREMGAYEYLTECQAAIDSFPLPKSLQKALTGIKDNRFEYNSEHPPDDLISIAEYQGLRCVATDDPRLAR